MSSGTLLTIWALGVIVTALVASRRGRNVVGFTVLAMLIWPVALILVALGPSFGRRCDACQELVQDKATVCPHCRRDIGVAAASIL